MELTNNIVEVFNNSVFGNIRVEVIDGEVWFVGRDLAEALKYKRPADAIKMHVREEDKGVGKIQTPGGIQTMILINESGMYDLSMGSTLPAAQDFRRWITKEVLPTIRKTGSYTIPKLSSKQLLEHTFRYTEEVDKKVDTLKIELEEFKEQMPLNLIDAEEIKRNVNRVAVRFLGGKGSLAYADKSLRGSIYTDIYRELKRQYGVTSYKAIRQSELKGALELIEGYVPPMVLGNAIKKTNSQMYWEV